MYKPLDLNNELECLFMNPIEIKLRNAYLKCVFENSRKAWKWFLGIRGTRMESLH